MTTNHVDTFNPSTEIITQKGGKQSVPLFDGMVNVQYKPDEILKKIKSGITATSKYTSVMNNIANMYVTGAGNIGEVINSEKILHEVSEMQKKHEKALQKNSKAKLQFKDIFPLFGFTTTTIRQKGLGNFRKDIATLCKILIAEEYCWQNVRAGYELMREEQLADYSAGIRKNLLPLTVTMQGIEKAVTAYRKRDEIKEDQFEEDQEEENTQIVDAILDLGKAKKNKDWKLVEKVLEALKEIEN